MTFKITNISRTSVITIVAAVAWIAVTGFGEFFGGAPNSACYSYLGCDAGFFGYDALEHFLFGFAAVWGIILASQKSPEYSILHADFLKSAITLVAIVALLGVVWEIGECFRDSYLLDIAHERLLDLGRHINYLAQPSNIDTMGDLSFALLGSLLATGAFYFHRVRTI